jgi:Na+/proline symporter
VLTGVVMWGYTLMLSVTSTIAYSTIFGALFDIGKVGAIILGSIYSTLGGMWSITLNDFVQFLVKTIGIFFILLPIALYKTGGFPDWPRNCRRWSPATTRSPQFVEMQLPPVLTLCRGNRTLPCRPYRVSQRESDARASKSMWKNVAAWVGLGYARPPRSAA